MALPTGLFPPAYRPDVRFRSRHVQKTLGEFIGEKLGELGWSGSNVNFGATPITLREVSPDENGQSVAPNTVSVTTGDIAAEQLQQLGGGLWEVVIPIFVDVYGDSSAIAQSIAEDVKDQLSQGLTLPMYDWSDVQNPRSVPGSYIELDNVDGPSRPQAAATSQDFRRFWRVVRGEAHVYYG